MYKYHTVILSFYSGISVRVVFFPVFNFRSTQYINETVVAPYHTWWRLVWLAEISFYKIQNLKSTLYWLFFVIYISYFVSPIRSANWSNVYRRNCCFVVIHFVPHSLFMSEQRSTWREGSKSFNCCARRFK